MPGILNLGSVNIDHVYRVAHFVRPGETLAGDAYRRGVGGKGLNQSVALAKAGARVSHLGRVGADGVWLWDWLRARGVDVVLYEPAETATGHAIIQVSPAGENAILLHAGANHRITLDDISPALARRPRGDHFLCQNETSGVPEALAAARARGLVTWFNPAPFHPSVADYPLDCVDWLIVNETEGRELSGENEADADAIVAALRVRTPRARIVLTLGSRGVVCAEGNQVYRVSPPPVRVVDTTAAGDTFIGYLAAGILAGLTTPWALDRACRAAAISVSRFGAADSVPSAREVDDTSRPAAGKA